MGYYGGLIGPHLPDEYDIRVLPQNAPQGVRKGEARLVVHCHLVHIPDLVLYGVFYGDDVYPLALDARQHRVQGRGLAAAGRAGGEDNALGPLDYALYPGEVAWKEPGGATVA